MKPLRVVSPTSGDPKLALRGLGKSFVQRSGDIVRALDEVSLDVMPGEFVCLIGPSGCGKSTLLNIVAGLDPPDRGEVLIDGRSVQGPGPDRAVLFQEPSLFPWLSVVRNIEFALELAGRPRRSRREVAMEWLSRVHLSRFANAQPHELSPGMRQRVALARALACEPAVLLADEPFGALDPQSRELLEQEVRSVWLDTGGTFLFVTNDVREAVLLADRVLLMSGRPGRLIAEHRISSGRRRAEGDVLLSRVAADVREQLLREVDRGVATQSDAGPGLA